MSWRQHQHVSNQSSSVDIESVCGLWAVRVTRVWHRHIQTYAWWMKSYVKLCDGCWHAWTTRFIVSMTGIQFVSTAFMFHAVDKCWYCWRRAVRTCLCSMVRRSYSWFILFCSMGWWSRNNLRVPEAWRCGRRERRNSGLVHVVQHLCTSLFVL